MINDNQHADGSLNHILCNDRNNEILTCERARGNHLCLFSASHCMKFNQIITLICLMDAQSNKIEIKLLCQRIASNLVARESYQAALCLSETIKNAIFQAKQIN